MFDFIRLLQIEIDSIRNAAPLNLLYIVQIKSDILVIDKKFTHTFFRIDTTLIIVDDVAINVSMTYATSESQRRGSRL